MGSYCSDPDISYHDGLYYLINRTTIRKARTGDVDIDYDTKVHLTIGSICDGGFNIQNRYVYLKKMMCLLACDIIKGAISTLV